MSRAAGGRADRNRPIDDPDQPISLFYPSPGSTLEGNEGSDRTLCRIVVDLQVTGFGVAYQLDPVAGQVAGGFAQRILRRHLWLGFLQPCVQLRQHR